MNHQVNIIDLSARAFGSQLRQTAIWGGPLKKINYELNVNQTAFKCSLKEAVYLPHTVSNIPYEERC